MILIIQKSTKLSQFFMVLAFSVTLNNKFFVKNKYYCCYQGEESSSLCKHEV